MLPVSGTADWSRKYHEKMKGKTYCFRDPARSPRSSEARPRAGASSPPAPPSRCSCLFKNRRRRLVGLVLT
ncbi:unnamed protein product [Rangifer tarandus platyrhynchus]|uniref:Uncharacterized protein n=1 Tax=Rangifer tarandus platyrhynchus TaxID=3082113 RepID=A0ABN8ZSQ2_RANTA|nr:unnamed protein product [Rangifer tarandus platyrhynchus]